jgi:hypothetical protein
MMPTAARLLIRLQARLDPEANFSRWLRGFWIAVVPTAGCQLSQLTSAPTSPATLKTFPGSADEPAQALISGLEGAMLVAGPFGDAQRFHMDSDRLPRSLTGVGADDGAWCFISYSGWPAKAVAPGGLAIRCGDARPKGGVGLVAS